MNKPLYGKDDTTFIAAGGEPGIRRIVDQFYDTMRDNAAYQTIMAWHPRDDTTSRDKLARFLCGWMGGPKLYKEKYGPIRIPAAHAHLKVTEKERDQWLQCMQESLETLEYPDDFIEYLMTQLFVPAERIRQACAKH